MYGRMCVSVCVREGERGCEAGKQCAECRSQSCEWWYPLGISSIFPVFFFLPISHTHTHSSSLSLALSLSPPLFFYPSLSLSLYSSFFLSLFISFYFNISLFGTFFILLFHFLQFLFLFLFTFFHSHSFSICQQWT